MRGLHIPARFPSTVGRIGPGIDTRGDDGYVVVPPSIHQSGHRYAFLGDPWAPIESAPAWLIVAARTKPVKLITERAVAAIRGPCGAGAYGQAALRAEIAALAATPPGCRNDALNRAAFNLFQLVAGGELAEAEVIAALQRACVANGLAADDGWQQRARHHSQRPRRRIAASEIAEARHDRGAAPVPGRGDRQILARGRGGAAPDHHRRADRVGQNRDRARDHRAGPQQSLWLAVSRPSPRDPHPDQQQAARNPARRHPARRPTATVRAGAGRERADAASPRHQGRHDGIARGRPRHRR